MRSWIMFFSGAAVALVCVWLLSRGEIGWPGSVKHTFSSFDAPRGAAAALQFDTGKLNLSNADLEEVLYLYQEVSARTVVRSPSLPAAKIMLRNQTPLSRVEALQLFDTTLVENGVTMVLAGDATVKAVPNRDAPSETPPTIDVETVEPPDSSSYMTCSVRLNHADPQQVVQMLTYSARLPNSVIYIPSGKLLILRDYSANVRKMMGLIQQAERQPLPWSGLLKPATNAAGNGRGAPMEQRPPRSPVTRGSDAGAPSQP